MENLPPERQQLIDKILAERDPKHQPVLLFADTNHFRSVETFQLAIQTALALRAQGDVAFGLEFLPASHQNILDALYEKKITKDEFLKFILPHSSENPGTETDKVGTGQFTKQEARQIFSELADSIEGGLRVYGLNRAFFTPQKPEVDLEFEKKTYLENQILLDGIGFIKEHSRDIAQNPALFFKKLKSTSNLAPEQIAPIQDELDKELATSSPPFLPAYLKAIINVFEAKHPATKIVDSCQSKEVCENNIDPERINDRDFIRARLSADNLVADKIEEALKLHSGMVVLYGNLHTYYGLTNARDPEKEDLDGALRQRGIGSMIVSSYFGAQTVDCTPLMSPETCSVWPETVQYLKDQEKASGDPDRYIIPDIKMPEIFRLETTPSPNAPKAPQNGLKM